MRPVYLLNGPNLNLLGQREPDIYGRETLGDVEAACRALAADLNLTLRIEQSNREYDLIDWVQEARTDAAGIVINPAGYGHTSIALMDALAACPCPVLEVHISNIFAREAFRHHSYVSRVAAGVISGFGTDGYLLALRRMAGLLHA